MSTHCVSRLEAAPTRIRNKELKNPSSPSFSKEELKQMKRLLRFARDDRLTDEYEI